MLLLTSCIPFLALIQISGKAVGMRAPPNPTRFQEKGGISEASLNDMYSPHKISRIRCHVPPCDQWWKSHPKVQPNPHPMQVAHANDFRNSASYLHCQWAMRSSFGQSPAYGHPAECKDAQLSLSMSRVLPLFRPLMSQRLCLSLFVVFLAWVFDIMAP